MDYRSAYIRRSRKGLRLNKRLAAAGVLGVAACAAAFALAMRPSAPSAPAAGVTALAAAPAPATAVQPAAEQVETKKTRRVYAYSIVPGGVLDRRELAHAIVVDKVVAAHYAAFEASKATVKTVAAPRGVYVSYRKGDKVYWTAKKLQLAQGETVLSDGQNEIRTRCGNRISDVPRLPVEVKGPSEEELDSSVEQAEEGDGDGSVAQVGFAVDGNPVGQRFHLQTFATSGTVPNNGTPLAHRIAGVPAYYNNNPVGAWDRGTLPQVLATGTSPADTGTGGNNGTGTGTGGGTGTGTDNGTGTGGGTGGGTDKGGSPTPDPKLPTTLDDTKLPSTDPGTKPPAEIPGTLLPPTTDLPGTTDKPGKTPTKPGAAPEPGTLLLGGAGVAALLAARRARKRTRG
ncbi:PEP-CTERM sorting domain-containing protein [Massilia sp. TW-1]|uniref:PEP-CTERM sorting domain-containing protein n=1 Tax=Telluria antibiotica TaxID=2717319 RepID=A0ABX0PC42_9BURK|nr:PEP-CTERM sorting domain-containing protein [Telluria antibiotica]NIA54570.1 PEP-CTERM sorting domain-containing protein [Telluria antibiotica]